MPLFYVFFKNVLVIFMLVIQTFILMYYKLYTKYIVYKLLCIYSKCHKTFLVHINLYRILTVV